MSVPDVDQISPEADRLSADLVELSGLAESGEPGWTRRIFSDAYRASRDWTRARMADAGMETHTDPAGNVIGILPGRNRSLPALMTGSHTDTVHGGGRFDGMVGVLGAIEAVRRLRETSTVLERDLIVADFLGEEANDFGISCMGSRAIAGLLTAEHLDRRNPDGQTLGDAMTSFGLDPSGAVSKGWRSDSLHGYVELHVEQGPLLERSGNSIGVVTAIAGIERLLASFSGRADHAGTMPMESRHDALAAAAAAVLTVERVGCGAPVHGVSTTGRIESSPGAFNIVPDEARVWAELRSIDARWLHGVRREVADRIAEEADRRGVQVTVEWLNDQDPVTAAPEVQDHIARASDRLGLSWEAVPSGAGHDAAHLAHLAPMGMIFVPSVGGRSHVPEELTESADIAAGAHVLAATLVLMDKTPQVAHEAAAP